MTEVKFRVWDSVGKEWIEAGFANLLVKDGYLYLRHPDSHWDFNLFTLLLDKDGKEVYEGDIVEFIYDIDAFDAELSGLIPINYKREIKAEVIWHEGGFRLKEKTGEDVAILLEIAQVKNGKVIGNIFEGENYD